MCTIRVFVSSHLLQAHLYSVFQSLILFLEDPYTAVYGMSACHRQKGWEKPEGINMLGESQMHAKPREVDTDRQFCKWSVESSNTVSAGSIA